MSRKYKFRDPDALYFVSFAVVGWVDVFTRSDYSEIFIDSHSYCQAKKGLELWAYVIMPNHVHLIISRNRSASLQDIMRDLKKYTAGKILNAIKLNQTESRKEWMLRIFQEAGRHNSNNTNYQFWQQDNHPIELSTNAMIDQKLKYLHNNPVAARIVDRAEDYLYSSARQYSGMKGSLNVKLIE